MKKIPKLGHENWLSRQNTILCYNFLAALSETVFLEMHAKPLFYLALQSIHINKHEAQR